MPLMLWNICRMKPAAGETIVGNGSDTMRLDKYLAKCGQGSRSQAKKVIRAGKVTVDEEEITDASHNLNPHAAQVAVEGALALPGKGLSNAEQAPGSGFRH